MTTDFNPPTTTLFSFAAAAASATVSINYDSLRGYSIQKSDAGAASTDRLVFQGKAVPASTPWTATMKIDTRVVGSGDFDRIGISLYDTVSGKLLLHGINFQGGTIDLTTMYFTALGTFSASPYSQAVVGTLPQWFRVSFDGTTYTFAISFDGNITWVTVASLAAASYFTANKVGIALETFAVPVIKPTALILYYNDPDF